MTPAATPSSDALTLGEAAVSFAAGFVFMAAVIASSYLIARVVRRFA